MSEPLEALARAAGIAIEWHDYRGQPRRVSEATLRRVLEALGLPATGEDACQEGMQALHRQRSELPPLLTADAGAELTIAAGTPGGAFLLRGEDGSTREGRLHAQHGRAALHVPQDPGYYRLELDHAARPVTVAVAPRRCVAVPGQRAWGIGVQLYSLSEPGDMGLATYGSLRRFAVAAANRGAHALAVSPTHAMFSADPGRRSPYAPSSRLFLNALHIDLDAAFGADAVAATLEADEAALAERLSQAPLVDWEAAGRLRLELLRRLHRRLLERDDTRQAFDAWVAAQGDALAAHARFETLHATLGGHGWHDWPAQYRDPDGKAARELAARSREESEFHLLLQWLARRQLDHAQRSCRDAGMSIGLIADLAIGAHPGGSHAWTRQQEIVPGLSVGAPPDLLAPQGQSWGLAAFSPLGLAANGFHAFIELLRASMASAGGLRIDHVMGLQRLWLIPEGADSSEGAYVSYPVEDLLRLVALESQRHRCIVIGEDLGTVDPWLRERLQERNLLGMSVLYFEERDGQMLPPAQWRRSSAAMSSTHDLPTLAGWWDGNDLEWRMRIGEIDAATLDQRRHERAGERERLWRAIAGESVLPDREAFVDAAIAHVASAASELALVPLEDVLGATESPNLPGTVDEHPNWRRRLPSPTPDALAAPRPSARLGALDAARRQP